MTSPEQAGRAASTASLSVPAFPDQLGLLRAMVRAAADHYGLSMDALATSSSQSTRPPPPSSVMLAAPAHWCAHLTPSPARAGSE